MIVHRHVENGEKCMLEIENIVKLMDLYSIKVSSIIQDKKDDSWHIFGQGSKDQVKFFIQKEERDWSKKND